MSNRFGLISLNELLAELGEPGKPLARSTFFRWKANGEAPKVHIKYPNGDLRFRIAEVERWLKTREQK
jgi:predicted DNA-binding transcriptional regulator AlpA